MSRTETATDIEAEISAVRSKVEHLREAIAATFLGQREVVEHLILSVLADGHALLEGAPGLGKTTLVKGLASAMNLRFKRIQFTPDLMPSDILGARILEETEGGGHAFRFERGPVFTNVLLADEINRATPRTQSALLEAMQERQVTVYGETIRLDPPFFVIATQNPIEMEGTYPLPEAQLDRFICKIELQSPGESELVHILEATTGTNASKMESILSSEELLAMRALVRSIPASSDIMRRVARLVRCTDPGHDAAPEEVRRNLRFGSSPRGGQAVLLFAKARALLRGHPWVSDEDVEAVAAPTLRHRVVFSYEGEASGTHPDLCIESAVQASKA